MVAFKDTVCIFYYDIHLKYCQDTDVYQYIDNLLQQWKTILREKVHVACLTQDRKIFFHLN